MLPHRDNFKLLMSLLVLCLVIEPALIFSTSAQGGAQSQSNVTAQEEQTPPPVKDRQRLDKPQTIFAPRWTNEDGFQAAVYIRNVHIERAVTAVLSLILNHRTITVPPIRVDSLQTVSIEVGKALADNGEKAEQSGSASIKFNAEASGQLNAYAQMLDTTRSLSFSFPFTSDEASTSGPMEAVTWRYSQNAEAYVALQNTTQKEVVAVPTIFASGRRITLGKRELKPHQTAIVKLPASETSLTSEGPQSVGVRIEYNGKPGAVVAQGWVIDKEIGFSAPFAFRYKSNCDCASELQHLYGTGIMIAAGGMGHSTDATASDMVFSPLVAMRNISGKPLSISPTFSFDAADKVENVTLPGVTLGPQETTVVNLRKYQEDGLFPLSVEMGAIDLQYKGEHSALVAEAASVDQNGSFVSPVPLACNGNPDQHMTFWRTDGDWHSSITVENISSQDSDLQITVSYPDGIYVLKRMSRRTKPL